MLYSEDVTVFAGESRQFTRMDFGGYTPAQDTPESVTVEVQMDGTAVPSYVVFTYVKNQAVVSLRHVADDGSVLYSEDVRCSI